MANEFKFGTVSTPCGKSGAWDISEFTITEEEARLHNIFSFRSPISWIEPGTYKRLCRGDTVVMSNTPMEIRTNREALGLATGAVLINGLGMGMLLEGMLHKPDVRSITVVEKDPDVIKLVKPTFAKDPRVIIINDDAFHYQPQGRFNLVCHDIWDDLNGDNLGEMATLNRKYGRRADKQWTWSRDWIRADARRR